MLSTTVKGLILTVAIGAFGVEEAIVCVLQPPPHPWVTHSSLSHPRYHPLAALQLTYQQCHPGQSAPFCR